MDDLFDLAIQDLRFGPQPKKAPTRDTLRGAADLGVKLLGGVPKAAGGLVGLGAYIPGDVGDMAAAGAQGLSGAGQWVEDQLLSDYQQQKEQEMAQAMQAGDGFVDSAAAAGKYLWENPGQAVYTAVGSVPSMLAGGLVSKGIRGAGLLLNNPAARAAIGEGAVIAGGVGSDIATQNPDDYSARMYGLAAGAGGAAIGRLGARLAGSSDIDTMIANSLSREALQAGGPMNLLQSLPRRVGMGVVGEGVVEEAPQSMLERAMTNVGTNKPWEQGLGAEAVFGGAAGGVMGGVAGIRRPRDAYTMAERDAAYSRLIDETQPQEVRLAAAQYLQRIADAGRPTDLLSRREDVLRQGNMDAILGAIPAWNVQRAAEAQADAQRAGVAQEWEQALQTPGQAYGLMPPVDVEANRQAAMERQRAELAARGMEMGEEVDLDQNIPSTDPQIDRPTPIALQTVEEEEIGVPAKVIMAQISSLDAAARDNEEKAALYEQVAQEAAKRAARLRAKKTKEIALREQSMALAARQNNLREAAQRRAQIEELRGQLPAVSVAPKVTPPPTKGEQNAPSSGQAVSQEVKTDQTVRQENAPTVGERKGGGAKAEGVPTTKTDEGDQSDVGEEADLAAAVVTQQAQKRKATRKPALDRPQLLALRRGIKNLPDKDWRKTLASIPGAEAALDKIHELTVARDKLLQIFSGARQYKQTKRQDGGTAWRRTTKDKVKQTLYDVTQEEAQGNLDTFYTERRAELQKKTAELHKAMADLEQAVGFNNIQAAQALDKASTGLQNRAATLFSINYRDWNAGEVTAEQPMGAVSSKDVRERRELGVMKDTKWASVYNGFKMGRASWTGVEALLMKIRHHSNNPFAANLSSRLYYILKDAAKDPDFQMPTVKFYTDKGLQVVSKNGNVSIDETQQPPHRVGAYDASTNTIHIGPEGQNSEVVLHELIHAALAGFVEQNPGHPAVKGLEALRGDVVDKLNKATDLSPDMGVIRDAIADKKTGLQEFLTYGLTNKEFQAFMQESVEVGKRTAANGFFKDAWNAFSALVRNILGIPRGQHTDFTRFLQASGELLGTGYVEQYTGGGLNAIDGKKTLDTLQKLENGKLTLTGPYGFNTIRDAWKEAQQLQKDYPDEAVYDLFRDLVTSPVIYGAGGYNRYTVNSEGGVVPIPESFSSKEKLAAAQEALGGANILNATQAKGVYGRIKDFFQRMVDTLGDTVFKIPRMAAGPHTMEEVLKHHLGPEVRFSRFLDEQLPKFRTAEGIPSAVWRITTPDSGMAFILETNGVVTVQTPALTSGRSGGWKVLQAAIAYAYHNNKIFGNELNSFGMTAKAVERYTEAMLSAAIKYGTTDFLLPHRRQLDVANIESGEGTLEDTKQVERWKKGALSGLKGWQSKASHPKLSPEQRTVHNMKLLAGVTAERTLDTNPELRKYSFDFAKGFLDGNGKAAPALTTTEKRAVLMNQLSDMSSYDYSASLAGVEAQSESTAKELGLTGVLYSRVSGTQTPVDLTQGLPPTATPKMFDPNHARVDAWAKPLFDVVGWSEKAGKAGQAMQKAAEAFRTKFPGAAVWAAYINDTFGLPPALATAYKRVEMKARYPSTTANTLADLLDNMPHEQQKAILDYIDGATTEVAPELKEAADDFRAAYKQLLEDYVRSAKMSDKSRRQLANQLDAARISDTLRYISDPTETRGRTMSTVRIRKFMADKSDTIESDAVVGKDLTEQRFFPILQALPTGGAVRIGYIAESMVPSYQRSADTRIDVETPWFMKKGERTDPSSRLTTRTFVRGTSYKEALVQNRAASIASAIRNTVDHMDRVVTSARYADATLKLGQENGLVYDDLQALLADNPHLRDTRIPTIGEAAGAPYGMRRFLRRSDQWVHIPEKSKQYGDLAGMYVNGSVWAALQDIHHVQPVFNSPAFNKVMAWFKMSKTVLSPGTHIVNIGSNLGWMYLHDIPVSALREAASIYAAAKLPSRQLSQEQRKLWRAFEQSGALISDYSSAELRAVLSDAAMEAMRTKDSSVWGLAEAMAVYEKIKASKAVQLGGKAIDTAQNLYAAEDNVFRLAAFLSSAASMEQQKGRGLTDEELMDAGADAAAEFLDYSIHARGVNIAKQTVLPFISWPYRAIPAVLKIAMYKPWKLGGAIAALAVLDAAAVAMTGGDDEDKRKRKVLPTYMNERLFGFGPHMYIQIPGLGTADRPVYFKFGAFIPTGDLIQNDSRNGFMGLPGYPQFITPNGPIVSALLGAVGGVDPFTGQKLSGATDSTWETFKKRALFLEGQMAPPMLDAKRIGDVWDKVVLDKRGPLGHDYDTTLEVAKYLGLRVQQFDIPEAKERQRKAQAAIEMEFKKEISKITKEAAKRPGDGAKLRERKDELMRRMKERIATLKNEED